MNLRATPPIFSIWPNNISFEISYLLFLKPHPKARNWGCKRLEPTNRKPLGLNHVLMNQRLDVRLCRL